MRSRTYQARLAAITGFLLLSGGLWIPLNFSREVRISASPYEVARQLTDSLRWLQWCPSLNRTNGTTLRLQYINPLSVAATLRKNNGTVRYEIAICPPLNDTSTVIRSSRPISLWRHLYHSAIPTAGEADPILALKSFMEHIPIRYGYDLRVIPVRDTLILTADTVLPLAAADTAAPQLYRVLLHFISRMHLPADTGFYYRTLVKTGDSLRLAVGVPVHRHDKDNAGIQFLRLPEGGKLLTVHYEGTYDGRSKVYKAMESYMRDHRLRPVAQPYERYPAADTLPRQGQNISIDLFCPVY